MAKHKIAVRDRGISLTFFIPGMARYSQKIVLIINFLMYYVNGKFVVCFTVQDTHRASKYYPLASFFAEMQSPTLLPNIKLFSLHISLIQQIFSHSSGTLCFCQKQLLCFASDSLVSFHVRSNIFTQMVCKSITFNTITIKIYKLII